MGSSVRIAVLKWSDIVAEYALFMLMTCLKNAWNLNFRIAAAIVNVFWGMMAIMPIFMKFMKLKFEMPDHWVVLLCSFAYTIGLGLLSFSTPKTVSGKTDNSNDVGHRTLFYMSLPFIAVARSGYAISLEKLINDEKGGILGTAIHFSLSIGAMFVVNIVGMTISYIVKQCSTRFGVPALCMVVSTLIFSTGVCSYGRRTTDSLFTTYFDTTHQPTTEQRNDPVIEETKFLISLFPIFLLGLVSSLGNTFFLEQAYSMKHKILAPLLLSLYKLAKFLFPKFYFDIADSWLPACCTGIKRGLNRIGMALSLIFALLCCVIAAKVESRRLNNKGHEQMSILYLVPQFFLLGGFYGMAYESIERFFKDCEIPDRMKPYMVDSAVGVFGLGNIGSVLLVHLILYGTYSWHFDSLRKRGHLHPSQMRKAVSPIP
ncbi:Proton-dependent oligopeptide transporter family [Parasponia andersonii]|uniref:Proton-dependent oligopeptide transporter family n=1 Tax=Parasponia andersonii TaxID=3476 RepID=A0A2P5BR60_PARAD|nr:Proton-dependent oligopeptide transporter family [Parasponia andersonii]